MKYWQHDETGLVTNCGYEPTGRWYEIGTVYEDELPKDLSQREYDRWYALSCVVDGVRVGPHPFATVPLPEKRVMLSQDVAGSPEVRQHPAECVYMDGSNRCFFCGVLKQGVA